jgi:hypothetical protein
MAIRMPASNLLRLSGLCLAGAMCPLFASRLEAQGDRPVSRELLAALTPPLVGDLDSVRKVEKPGNPRAVAWLVKSKSVGAKTEDRFRRDVIKATGGRLFTPSDSSAMVVRVESMRLAGDSAEVYVERTDRLCDRGRGSTSGAIYIYRFVHEGSGWRFVNRSPYIYYDPPIVAPDVVPSNGCAHLFEM